MSVVKFKASKGNVFIRPVHDDYKGKIILPDTVAKPKMMPDKGIVVAIGGRRIFRNGTIVENDFKVGDLVLFKKFSGLLCQIDGEDLVQVKIHDIEAIFS